jgi:hypothetical protein
MVNPLKPGSVVIICTTCFKSNSAFFICGLRRILSANSEYFLWKILTNQLIVVMVKRGVLFEG